MAENNALWNWGNQQTYHEKIKQEIEKASTGGVTIDDTLSTESTNPIQNKAVAEALAETAVNKVLTTSDEVNNPDLESGIYSVEGVAMSFPCGTRSYYVLIANKHRKNAGYGSQLGVPYTDGNMVGVFYRNCANGIWNDWKNVADGGNAATINTQTLSAPTTAFTAFYPCFVDSDNNVVAAENVKTNAAYRFQMKSGTADAEGTARLMLGNQILSGTEGNMRGQVVFFNNANAYYAILVQNTSQTNNVTHILPASGGTLALNTVATASANGLMSTGTQTFAGAKTFNGVVKVAGATAAGTSQVRNIAAGTAEATTTNCPNGALYGQYS